MIRYCFSCTKAVNDRDAIRRGEWFCCPTCQKGRYYLGSEPVSLSTRAKFRDYDHQFDQRQGALTGTNYIDPAIRLNMERLACEELLTYNSRNVEALYNLGRIYQSEFNLKLAKEYYLQALAINPEHLESHHRFAELCISEHRFNDAIIHLDVVLGITPEDPQLHFNYAIAHHFAGRGGEAIRHLEIARELSDDPDFLKMVDQVLGQLV